MPTKKKEEIKKIRGEVKSVKKTIKNCNNRLEDLTERLQELELYSSESEEELPKIEVGDRVEAITKPNLGRQGVVTVAQRYWITVKADWTVVEKDGHRNEGFTKARHNLKKL